MLGALFALTYGDGQRNLPAILLHDTRLKRWGSKSCWDEAVVDRALPCYRASGDGLPDSGRLWLYVACVFVAINLLIFLYVRLWWGSPAFLHTHVRGTEPWKAVPMGPCLNAVVPQAGVVQGHQRRLGEGCSLCNPSIHLQLALRRSNVRYTCLPCLQAVLSVQFMPLNQDTR